MIERVEARCAELRGMAFHLAWLAEEHPGDGWYTMRLEEVKRALAAEELVLRAMLQLQQEASA